MGTTNILDMNNRISALEKSVTSVETKINDIFTIKEVSKTVTTNGNGVLSISSEFNLDLDKCIVTSIHTDSQYKFELYNIFYDNVRTLNIAVISATADSYYRIKNSDVPVLVRYIEWN